METFTILELTIRVSNICTTWRRLRTLLNTMLGLNKSANQKKKLNKSKLQRATGTIRAAILIFGSQKHPKRKKGFNSR